MNKIQIFIFNINHNSQIFLNMFFCCIYKSNKNSNNYVVFNACVTRIYFVNYNLYN